MVWYLPLALATPLEMLRPISTSQVVVLPPGSTQRLRHIARRRGMWILPLVLRLLLLLFTPSVRMAGRLAITGSSPRALWGTLASMLPGINRAVAPAHS